MYKRFLSSDTEDYGDFNRFTVGNDKDSVARARSNRFSSVKGEKIKGSPKKRSVERSYSSRIGVESISDSGFQESIKKKISKRRGNLENLCGE